MIDATQIRKGMIIIMDGTLWRVMEMQLITPGRWKAMVQTKLRNIQNGSQTEHRFRSEERLEQARLDETEMEFPLRAGRRIRLHEPRELRAGQPVRRGHRRRRQVPQGEHGHRGRDVRRPARRRQPPQHDGAQGREHRAPAPGRDQDRPLQARRRRDGAVVQVPEFIKEGDVIRVDTRDDKYLGRA